MTDRVGGCPQVNGPVITTSSDPGWPPANLVDYDAARSAFSWAEEERRLGGLPGEGLNIAHVAVDRHADGPLADTVALRFLRRSGEIQELTYAQLSTATSRFANVLTDLGIERGQRVFCLTGRIPELYVTAIGTFRAGAVFCPLFSAFGPEPVQQRLERGNGRVLVTTASLFRKRVAPLLHRLPELDHVLLVDGLSSGSDAPQTAAGKVSVHDLQILLDAADPDHTIAPTGPEDPALVHFTSGSTGAPKGALHVHRAVVAHHATAVSALDLRAGDVFWCTADPGWVTGTSYGIVAPLAIGVTSIVDEGDFDVVRWYRTLEEQRVNVWYTAPTALRLLMRAGEDPIAGLDLSALRLIASVGEPLAPDVVEWTDRVLGRPAHDNWWQTETGGIMIANLRSSPIRAGSMGRPLPGVEAAILEVDEGSAIILDADGAVQEVTEAGRTGMLALRRGWPSLFRGYLHEPDRTARTMVGDWYLSGDLASRDADGWYWFVGRADDVIKTAGHLIGPFEVEKVLTQHPAVAEAAAIGVPDAVAGNVVKAFVTLRPGLDWDDDLRLELVGFARSHLGAAVAPRQIEQDQHLPRTRSGKIMRRLLRARELGLPEGDLSTLEPDADTDDRTARQGQEDGTP